MQTFDDPPSVELLQWFARGSLKQNLPRAIRLWVWLRVLYGEGTDRLQLPEQFAYTDWRDTFFTATHPTGEAIPHHDDPTCRCTILTQDWLFTKNQIPAEAVEGYRQDWLTALQRHDVLPTEIAEILNSRLFQVTRRTLSEDLQILCKLGWVKRQGRHYSLVNQPPNRPQPVQSIGNMILQSDLAAIAENLSRQINGHQRFFLHTEYIVPPDAIDQVDDWQSQLKDIWHQTPVPPVQLSYHSARLQKSVQIKVYPVCIYYSQRAPYLSAWGEVPEDPTQIDWRHYRLDRIQQIQILKWGERSLPKAMYQAYRTNQLPVPDEIQQKMSEAWGFDFYLPDSVLVLRFDRQFFLGYIQNTVRHETFTKIRYSDVKDLIQHHTPDRQQREALLKVWQNRSKQDAYYKAQYRQGDLNILLRLRAWRPKMEVLFPWSLREAIAAEVMQEMKFYSDR